jgi:hypothetical protein
MAGQSDGWRKVDTDRRKPEKNGVIVNHPEKWVEEETEPRPRFQFVSASSGSVTVFS